MFLFSSQLKFSLKYFPYHKILMCIPPGFILETDGRNAYFSMTNRHLYIYIYGIVSVFFDVFRLPKSAGLQRKVQRGVCAFFFEGDSCRVAN